MGEADTGRAAVEAIRRLAPDLLFLDVSMPEMDGSEVLQRLGARAPLSRSRRRALQTLLPR